MDEQGNERQPNRLSTRWVSFCLPVTRSPFCLSFRSPSTVIINRQTSLVVHSQSRRAANLPYQPLGVVSVSPKQLPIETRIITVTSHVSSWSIQSMAAPHLLKWPRRLRQPDVRVAFLLLLFLVLVDVPPHSPAAIHTLAHMFVLYMLSRAHGASCAYARHITSQYRNQRKRLKNSRIYQAVCGVHAFPLAHRYDSGPERRHHCPRTARVRINQANV